MPELNHEDGYKVRFVLLLLVCLPGIRVELEDVQVLHYRYSKMKQRAVQGADGQLDWSKSVALDVLKLYSMFVAVDYETKQ